MKKFISIAISVVMACACLFGACAKEEEIIYSESVTINKTEITLALSKTEQLIATVTPADADNKTIMWESDNKNVASVDIFGLVTANSVGEANIIATTLNGKTATCKVKVVYGEVKVTSVNIAKENVSVQVARSVEIVATVLPENATDKSLIWVSSDNDVVTVDDNGAIVGVKEGTAKVTATSVDGGLSDSINVIVVSVKVSSVKINENLSTEEEIYLESGKTFALTLNIYPIDAKNKNVVWASSNNNVATVDENGVVTTIKDGVAYITVTSEDGGITDDCKITVGNGDAEVLTLTTKAYAGLPVHDVETMFIDDDVNGEHEFIVRIKGLYRSVSWAVDNQGVVTISPIEDNTKCVVKAVAKGNTVLTVTVNTSSGVITKSCVIEVRNITIELPNA